MFSVHHNVRILSMSFNFCHHFGLWQWIVLVSVSVANVTIVHVCICCNQNPQSSMENDGQTIEINEIILS